MIAILYLCLLAAAAIVAVAATRVLAAATTSGRIVVAGRLLADRADDPAHFGALLGFGISAAGALVAAMIWLAVELFVVG